MAVSRSLFMVTIGVLTGLLLFSLCPQFPETVSNRWVKMFICTFQNLLVLIGSYGECVGLSFIAIVRCLIRIGKYVIPPSDTILENSTQLARVPVVISRPKGSNSHLLPAIVYYHAGGWSLFDAESAVPLTRILAEQTESVIVSVSYRKAPEHVFPAAFEDSLAVAEYVLLHGEELGINVQKVAVKGDSSGANLAMAVALYISNQKSDQHPPLRLVSLDNPALQALDFNLPSYTKYATGPCYLNKKLMLRFWLDYAFGNNQHLNEFSVNNHTWFLKDLPHFAKYVSQSLLPKEFQEDSKTSQQKDNSNKNEHLSKSVKSLITNPYFAPLMASDEELGHLPQVYIVAVEFDVLRDDSFLLAGRLARLGLKPELSYYPTEMHAFVSMVNFDRKAMTEIQKFTAFFKGIMAEQNS